MHKNFLIFRLPYSRNHPINIREACRLKKKKSAYNSWHKLKIKLQIIIRRDNCMLSKNNRKEQFRKQEPKKQRFAIKKLTVGVASVLIGFTFMGMSASADTTADANSEAGGQSVAETQNSASNQANSQATLTTPNSQGIQSSDNQTVSAAPASETAAQKYENAVSDAIEQATKAAAAKSGDA